jgi:hypothetical protein
VRAEGDAPVAWVRLIWEAEAGTEACLTRAELERLVEVELERSVFVSDDAATARILRVRLERDTAKGGFRALVTRENAGNDVPVERPAPAAAREVTARECRDIDEPLALVVALLADADETPPESALETKEEELPPPEPEPPPDKQDEIQPLGPVTTAPGWEAAQREARFRYEADLAAATGFGVLPHVGIGAELGFLAEPPSLPGLRLRVLGLVSQPAEPVPGATVDFAYAMAGFSLCPAIARFARVTVRFCAGADLGALHARSEGLEEANETTEFFGQADLMFRGALALGNGFLGTLSVGAVLPTKVDRFVYRQDGEKTEIFQMAFMPFLVTAGASYEIL